MVDMGRMTYFWFWMYTIFTVVLTQDPCSTTNLLDSPTRSTKYMLTKSDDNSCDRLIMEGWYKVPENGNIPTECPPILRCGSTNPIWLNGTLPTVRGGRRNLIACQRGFLDCCELSFAIEVLNCGDFNVYNLKAIPACPGRYCTVGAPAPCPPGMSSDTGFEPCQRLDITFSVTPKVEPFIPTRDPLSDTNQLAFKCKTSMPSSYHGYVFDVAWYINGKERHVIKKIQYSSLESGGVLHRKNWDPQFNSTLGFQVRCAIRARQSTVSPPTPYSTSDDFFAGVQFEKTSFAVKSGETVNLKFKSTVPVACRAILDIIDCDIDIELYSFQDQFKGAPAHCNDSLSDKKPARCGISFNGEKWNEYHTFTVNTLSDQSKRPSYTCSTNLIAGSRVDTLWFNYILPEIKIHVSSEERPQGTCSSYNDPHLNTFDGSYYITHERGEFVLYRHREKPIEVHTIHRWQDVDVTKWTKEGWASNCAIVVRAAADVFVIYGCFSQQKWITRRLNCDREHQYLEIYQRDKKYEVILPTGTRIEIYIKTSWLNIYIYLSPSDWEKTEGLCGTYNGKSNDDFTDREGNVVEITQFVRSWWVPQSQSLYIARSRKEKLSTEVLFCSCYNDTIVGNDKERADCEWKENLPLCKPLNWIENKCEIYGRTKREIEDDFEFDVPVDVVNFEQGQSEFEWKNGWTEEKARNACTSYSKQSKLYAVCSKLTNVDDTNNLETCIADIKISGTGTFLSASLDRMKSTCVNEIRVNTTFWKPKIVTETTTKSIDGSTKLPSTTSIPSIAQEIDFNEIGGFLEIVETVFDNDCPDDCSNSGKCIQGICECYEGFVGEDCSVNARKPPELFGASEESLCDVSKRPCTFLSFFGKGFYDSSTLKCRVTEARFEDQSIKPGMVNVTTDGILVSFSELKCPVDEVIQQSNRTSLFPILDAILVSVSFNNKEYSTDSPVVIYDSRCTSCHVVNDIIECTEKEDICIVQNVCYQKGSPACKTETKGNAKSSTTGMKLGYIGLFLGGISIIMTSTILRLRRL